MKLRSHLITLVVSALTPVLIFSAVMVVLFWRDERQAVERGVRETVRALVVAIDRELEASLIAMEALATARTLDTGDLAEFYDQAARVADSRTTWLAIALVTPEGEQVLNTVGPFGSALPAESDREYFRRVIESRRPVVSDLFLDRVSHRHVVAAAVPVIRNGRLRSVLVAVLDARAFGAILREQRVAEGWPAIILDRSERAVASTSDAGGLVGRSLAVHPAGTGDTEDDGFRSVSGDGREMYTAISRSPLTHWTVALAAPAAVVEGSLQRSLLAIAAGGALFLLLGTALAMRFGARIATSIVALARSAEAVGRGEAPASVASPVDEVNDVGRALGDAAVLLRLSSVERERAAAAARVSEERLRFSLEAAQIGAWDWDVVTGAVTWSPTLESIHGLPAGAFGGTIDDYCKDIHPDDRERVVRALTGVLSGAQDHDLEYRIVRPDGSVRWVQGRGRVVRDATGRPARMSGVCFDITARKRADEERARLLEREQAARAEAEDLNRTKDEFLATLSHELRTPLNALMGWARLLRSPNIDEATAARAIEVIERNTRMQAQLVGDLLDVSRIITGKLRLDVRPVVVTGVIEAAVDAIRAAADARQITIVAALDPGVGPLHGDADRLQQIVWNLLSNAVKFTPPGGTVTVSLARRADHAEVAVADTGKGIAAEFLPYVFDRFRQADSATTRSHGGLGIGLAIVRHLAEMHGGTVHAESAGPGQGATFTVRLPLPPAPGTGGREPAPGATREDDDSASGNLPSLDGLRVLVVEDEADTREVLARVFERCGARVTAVASATEALETFGLAPPDVLISDIAMPGEDGYSLIRKIRGLHADARVPAVALTACAGDGDRERALAAGFQLHVPKPADVGELAQAVAALTGRPRDV